MEPADLDDVVAELQTLVERADQLLWFAEGGLKIACLGFGVFVIHYLFSHFGKGVFSEFED